MKKTVAEYEFSSKILTNDRIRHPPLKPIFQSELNLDETVIIIEHPGTNYHT